MTEARRVAIKRRHIRIRKYLRGTKERPRLSIARSLRNISAQFVDDLAGKTLLSVSTLDKALRASHKSGGNIKSAAALGELAAKKAIGLGITSVVFDRGGCLYHGRIKAFAEAARKAGLKF